ncbi:MAG: thioredoxin family protein [Phycisphaerae bacterium]|jgi:thioredoxin 1
MRNIWKIVIVLILASAVVAVVVLKKAENKGLSKPITTSATKKNYEANDVNVSTVTAIEPNNAPLVMTVNVVEPAPAASTAEPKKLPRMIELGSDKCIPCKMMAPIIEELKKECAGKLQTEFYDVWQDPTVGRKFGIRVIPTQIFIDANDKELFRHEGFFAKKDILAKWKKLGFEFNK